MNDVPIGRRGLLAAIAIAGVTGGGAAVAAVPRGGEEWQHVKHRGRGRGKGRPGRPTKRPRPTTGPTAGPTAEATGSAGPSPDPSVDPTIDPTVPSATASTNPPMVATAAWVGMSAPANAWSLRVQEVGPGLGARRIFADLAAGASSQLKLVEQAHADGMLPVISYKVGGDIAGAMAGKYNAVADQAAARLASYGLPTAVSFWHEPNPDISGEQYAAASRQLLPFFKRGELRVGPILNGWLLDRQEALFESYCPEDLYALWDWVGIDTYEAGTSSSPGSAKPGPRIPRLRAFLNARRQTHPIGVGEYNGYSPETITAAGEALLATPNVWFGCLWNSVGEKGFTLDGDRLEAFRDTLADPRVATLR